MPCLTKGNGTGSSGLLSIQSWNSTYTRADMSDSDAFRTLDLAPPLLNNLANIGYLTMTPVQAKALPEVLAGRDVLARAKTGSGKTAVFGLGLLNALDVTSFRVQALVLCPTRELADQVAREIRRLAQSIPNIKILTLCGGTRIEPQYASLRHSPHVIVGTPGRVLKHLRQATVDLAGLQTLVLDEADRLLDMGFTEELDAILAFVPTDRQTLLFSATYPDTIGTMSARVQQNPIAIDVTNVERPAPITQYWCSVTRETRNDALVRALCAWGGALNLVFCNTRVDCSGVLRFLQSRKIAAVALHGDFDQPQRTEVLVRFANGSASVLVATDVAARGLDIDAVDAVFNYELPAQPEIYVHRVGRTGRAGKKGVAISLVEPREVRRLLEIEARYEDARPSEISIPTSNRKTESLSPAMTTIRISGGRKNKLRPGDLLGALTAKGGVSGDVVGSIDLFDTISYVAIRNAQAKAAMRQLADHPIKGRRYRARIVE